MQKDLDERDAQIQALKEGTNQNLEKVEKELSECQTKVDEGKLKLERVEEENLRLTTINLRLETERDEERRVAKNRIEQEACEFERKFKKRIKELEAASERR